MLISQRLATTLAGCMLMGFPASAMLAAPDSKNPNLYRLNLDAALMARQFNARPYQLGPQYRPAEPVPSRSAPSPAKVGLPALPASTEHLTSQPYSKQIEKAALAAALDPVLVHAVIYVESRYHHSSVSLKGAVGLMQILPETAARYGINDPSTPQANLKAGTLYLSYLMRMFNNRLDLALAAYNAGEGTVQRYANKIPPYPETQQYVRDVLAKYNEWRNAPYIVRTAAMEATAALADKQDKEMKEMTAKAAAANAKPAATEYLSGTRLVELEPSSSAD